MRLSRDLAADLVVGSGLLRLLGSVASRLSPDIRVLAYHRVLPATDEESFGYDLELISAWEEEFEWQVRYLARNHDVITCRELASLLDSGSRIPRRALIVTFDDGYRDNHHVALPILQRYKVPAVMFVATGYIDGQATYWFDELVHDVLHTTATVVALDAGRTKLVAIGSTPTDRRRAANALLQHLKPLPDAERIATLGRIKASLGQREPVAATRLDAPMSWAEVEELSRAGIEIGSHSVTHPVLANVDDAQLHSEMRESKAQIELRTGLPVSSLAYPVGGRGAYDDRVVRAARDAGYRFAFTYGAGPNPPKTFDAFRMRRLAVERYLSRNRFVGMLGLPSLFANQWSSG